MKNQIKVTFKDVDNKSRLKLLKALIGMGLDEVASMHDDSENRHAHEFHLDEVSFMGEESDEEIQEVYY